MKWHITHSPPAVLVGKKSSNTKTAQTYAPTKYKELFGKEESFVLTPVELVSFGKMADEKQDAK
jgi:hypothetical protein